MDQIGPIRTIRENAESILKEKNSEFLGIAFPAESEERIAELLSRLKKKFFDAAHHCYAWRLRNNSFRYSDDGEPNGTAGVRILNAIDHFRLVDVLVVVVRYFGGVKLGAGPLGKAYFTAAEGTISASEIIEKQPYASCRIIAPYEYTSPLYHIIDKYGVKIIRREFGENPVLECFLPYNQKEEIIAGLKTSSGNRIHYEIIDEIIFS